MAKYDHGGGCACGLEKYCNCSAATEEDLINGRKWKQLMAKVTEGKKDLTNEPKEAVNHPDHYGGEDNPYEVIKVIRAWGLGFSLGNTVKYVARAGKKDPNPKKTIEDLEKAIWYIREEIDAIKRSA